MSKFGSGVPQQTFWKFCCYFSISVASFYTFVSVRILLCHAHETWYKKKHCENRWNYRREPLSSTLQLSELLPGIMGIQSAYKAIGFLKEKATHGFFFSGYYLQTAVLVDLFPSLLRSIMTVLVNFYFYLP